MGRKRSLIQIYLISLIALAAIPVAIYGSIWIATEYDRFTEQSENLRNTYVDSRNELLRREVGKAADYIDYKRSQLNRRLYQELRQEVTVGLALVSNVHKEYGGRESMEMVLGRIGNILDPLRFHDGKGFFFALHGEGETVLAPLHPETRQRLGNTEILASFSRQIQNSTRDQNHNFLEFRFTDLSSGESSTQRNISFVYYYRPLDLYLGAGVYYRDEIDRIKQEVLDRLAAVPFDPDSSMLFVTDLEGRQLVNPYNPDQIGEEMTGLVSGLQRTAQSEQADSEGGRLVAMQWPRQQQPGTGATVSYVRAYPDWGWVLGAGFFLDRLDALLETERAELETRVFNHATFILLVAISLILLAVLVARRLASLSAGGFQTFQQFFAEASERSTHIDVNELPFAEFGELALHANYMVETRSETERALKLSERRFQLALDASQNHLWDMDLTTDVISIGENFYKEMKYPLPQEPRTLRDFLRLCHPNDTDLISEVMSSWDTESTAISIEFRFRDNDGNYHWIMTRGDVVETDAAGKPTRAMGIMSDISERKRMENELVAARIAAEDANHAKSQFLSSVSHELRTPLNGVLGYAQLLQRQPDLPTESASYLSAIESCGQHLLNLINDVLDLAKIESGNLNIEYRPARIRDIVSNVRDIVRQRAEAKGLEYKESIADDIPDIIRTDEVKLRQVLVNLLDNAVKFTAEGSVELKLALDPATRHLLFSVTDSGMGIPASMLQDIFEPFRQVNQHEGKGTGLGLSICRRLCEAMGGGLDVTSEEGVGSRFAFDIPLLEVNEDGEDISPAKEHNAEMLEGMPLPSKLDIIVADDNSANSEVLAGMVRPLASGIRLAQSGQEVLDMLAERPADLVLMDLRMPGRNGIETTQLMKQDPAMQKAVVIMVSASTDSETVQAALDAGCSAYVAKPVQMEELLDSIVEHCADGLTRTDNSRVFPPPTEDGASVAWPEAERQQLLEFLALGDIAAIESLLDSIENRDPECGKLAGSARKKLQNFDIDGLQALLKG